MSWVFDHSEAVLGSRLVLLAIANHADRDGKNSYASVPTLAEEAKLSERQTQRSISSLKKTGELVQSGKKTLCPGITTNVYEIVMAKGGDNMSPGGVTSDGGRGDIDGTGGVTPAPPNPKGNPSFKTKKAGPPPAFRLVSLWKRDFFPAHKREYVDAPKDFKAAKDFLASSGKLPEDVIGVARVAWTKKGAKFWNCEKAVTVHYFCTHYNEIAAELGSAAHPATQGQWGETE